MAKSQITLGAGCFWCVEAVFKRLKGVTHVEPGYSNGALDNPTYRQVCSGTTGHAEVVRVEFDDEIIDLEKILDVFWHTHNPTTLNRQGNDIGTQYRSGIYYENEDQRVIAEQSKKKTDATDLWEDPIITEILPIENYHTAETYHHDYFENNPRQPYCSAVIPPKIRKLKEKYSDILKAEET